MWIKLFKRMALPAAAVFGYAQLARPWLKRWGTTAEELDRIYLGDGIVSFPQVSSTRAITVDAPPGAIWPWLVQMGQGRGGLYSYDWLENLFGCDIHSAERIRAEWQSLTVGDEIRLVPIDFPVDLRFEVAVVEPNESLVLRSPGRRETVLEEGYPFATWGFFLRPQGGSQGGLQRGGTTRLIVRYRAEYRRTLRGLFWNQLGLEPVMFLMERKMLLGLKERAEKVPLPEVAYAGVAEADATRAGATQIDNR